MTMRVTVATVTRMKTSEPAVPQVAERRTCACGCGETFEVNRRGRGSARMYATPACRVRASRIANGKPEAVVHLARRIGAVEKRVSTLEGGRR